MRVHPITLGNTAFEGENTAYFLPGEVPTLVDTGVPVPETRAELEAGLDEYGHTFADVEQVLVTHWHGDHAGLAGAVQAASGAVVRAHPDDLPLVAGHEDALAAYDDRMDVRFTDYGMPADKRAELDGVLAAAHRPEMWPDVTPIEAGETVAAGDGEVTAVPLPGHTVGLVGFAFDSDDGVYAGTELFSGDALLPYYTPNVGGADVRMTDALATYCETLAHIEDADYSRAWPGHRGPIIDPAGRARDIIDHHRERTERVVGVLREHGPCDAWTVSAHLFGSLSYIHIMHGPGEAASHLDHLLAAGIVAREGNEYRLVEPAAALDALFP